MWLRETGYTNKAPQAKPNTTPKLNTMKKALILALGLATLPTMAGVQTVVYTQPAPAACASPYTFELGALYAFANDNVFRGGNKSVDVYGGDLTAVYHVNLNHSFNLRLGYTFGDGVDRSYGLRRETDLHTFSLLPGYRYTHAFNDKWSMYIGANIGVANVSAKDNLRGSDVQFHDHNSEYGFAYSAEAGLRYRLCENSEVFVAYQFYGSNATPSTFGNSMHKQTYNAVRTGVSFKF